jgi:hypothetical protein
VNEDSPAVSSDVLNLQLAAARYQLGLLPSSEFPGIAMAALEAGFNGVGLCDLSCEQHPTLGEHAAVFERALRECYVSLPSTEAAVECVLRHYLQAIASGELSPRRGLRRIVNDLYAPHISKQPVRTHVGDQRNLEHLIGAFYSYDELCERPGEVSFEGLYGPAAVSALDSYVRHQADEWLQRHCGTA